MADKIYKQIFGDLSSWIFVLLCFAYPVSATLSAVLGVPSTPVNITYRALSLALSCFTIICAIVKRESYISKYAIPLLTFLVVYLLRIIWDTLIIPVYSESGLIEIYSFYLGSIIFPVIAILLTFKYADLKLTIVRAFYVLVLGNLLLVLFYFSQNAWNISPTMLLSRAEIKGLDEESLIVNPISFGLYGGYLFLLCFSVLLTCKNNFSKSIIFLMKIFLFLGLFNLIIGTSRGPFLFSFISLMVIFRIYFSHIRMTLHFYMKLLGILIVFILIVGYLYNLMLANDIEIGVFQRFISMKENYQSNAKEGREELYIEAWEMFRQSPIVGKQFVLESGAYPHNVILEILMSTGLMGGGGIFHIDRMFIF